LRLTVRDTVGHETVAFRTVTVDTTPPLPPAGLRAEIRRETEELVLHWTASPDLDLAGYRLFRDGEPIADGLSEPTFTESELGEGIHDYELVAIDRAGNQSAPAKLRARFDITPPLASIQIPETDAAVSGDLEIRGSAFSAGSTDNQCSRTSEPSTKR
jgi:hypothetical protein